MSARASTGFGAALSFFVDLVSIAAMAYLLDKILRRYRPDWYDSTEPQQDKHTLERSYWQNQMLAGIKNASPYQVRAALEGGASAATEEKCPLTYCVQLLKKTYSVYMCSEDDDEILQKRARLEGVLKILCEAGARMDLRGKCDGNFVALFAGNSTALMISTQLHHPTAFQILLEFGADPRLRDAEGATVLHYFFSQHDDAPQRMHMLGDVVRALDEYDKRKNKDDEHRRGRRILTAISRSLSRQERREAACTFTWLANACDNAGRTPLTMLSKVYEPEAGLRNAKGQGRRLAYARAVDILLARGLTREKVNDSIKAAKDSSNFELAGFLAIRELVQLDLVSFTDLPTDLIGLVLEFTFQYEDYRRRARGQFSV